MSPELDRERAGDGVPGVDARGNPSPGHGGMRGGDRRADAGGEPVPGQADAGEGSGRDAARHVLLIGFMGAGKSTVARRLARRYGKVSFDTDAGISRMVGKSIPEIFSGEGEQAFRRYECEYLQYLKGMEPGIVSCGGGIVTYEGSRRALRELGFVVYLDVSVDEVYRRISSTESRPNLSDDRRRTEELYESRLPLYMECADLVVDTNGKSSGAVARELGNILVERGVIV